MPSTYSSLLRFELQANGENSNTWGTKTNNNLTLIENKIASYLEVALVNGTNTLSANDGSSDQNRRATLEFTGALTSAASVEVKAVANWWIMKNSTTGGQTLTIQTSLGTGYDLPLGDSQVVWTDGTTVEAVGLPVSVSATFAHINTLVVSSASITTPLGVGSGGTGVSVFSSGTVLVGNGTSLVQVAPSVVGTALMSNGVSAAPSFQLPVPPGIVLPYAGSAAPDTWLLCDGSEVSRSTYAALYNVIGTTFGSGDGSTTFNIPDMRGRVPAGVDGGAGRLGSGNSGGITGTASLGAVGGEQSHTNTSAEMPVHTHNVTDPGHVHVEFVNDTTGGQRAPASSNTNTSGDSTLCNTGSATTGISLGNAGSGNAHNNVQPTLVLNYIIKT